MRNGFFTPTPRRDISLVKQASIGKGLRMAGVKTRDPRLAQMYARRRQRRQERQREQKRAPPKTKPDPEPIMGAEREGVVEPEQAGDGLPDRLKHNLSRLAEKIKKVKKKKVKVILPAAELKKTMMKMARH